MNRIFLFFLLIMTACGSFPHPPLPQRSESFETKPAPLPLKIFALDVGQGDATVVMTPNKKVLLIDGGPLESGLERIIPFLEENGVERLDSIFVSQYDGDHIGGVLDLVPGKDRLLGTEDDWVPLNG
ncbi:MAG: hypothetical protein Q7S00_05505, partial [bacterium]|nr:hypothetical protein [bacterium]